jgi:type I restriction enzyme S subunit
MKFATVPLKHFAAIPITNGVGEAAEFDDPAWPRYVRTTDIDGPRSLRDDTFRSLPPEVAQRAPLNQGDLVMTAAGGVGKSFLYMSTSPACYAGYLVRFRPKSSVDGRYVAYWAESQHFWDQLEMGKVASTIDNFSAGKYQNLRCPAPNLLTQRQIADYLDTETARIEALVAKKQQMIEAFRERQIVFESSVVLAPGSQPTPIATMPSVPDTWRVLRNKVFMREVNEPSLEGTEEMLSVSHLTGVTPRSEKTVYMFEAESTVGYKVVRPGDLVINTMWAWMGAAGVARVPGIVSPAYGVYRIDPSIMTPDYFDIVVRTPAYINEMTRFSRGVTSSRLRLYPEEFLGLSSPVPPVNEQSQIVERCFTARRRTSRLIERLERQINLLREYRQALITSAVTGELAVPGVAA